MKLSDIKGDKCLDVIADLIEPISNIASDEKAAAIFKPQTVPEGMEPVEFLLKRVKENAPQLIREHKADVIAILAAVNLTTPKKYQAKMSIPSLATEFFEIINDEDLLTFFTLQVPTEE